MHLKKIILFVLILFNCSVVFAQFKLSGKIKNYLGKEELKINIPLVFGFYKENTIAIPVAKDGSFAMVLNIDKAKFANLIFQRTFHTLLLHKGKDLTIEINEKDSTVSLKSGTALPEIKVMQVADIEQYPFFLINEGKAFSDLSLAALREKVVVPYFAQRDEKIKKVMASGIANKDKLLIAAELKYIAFNYLNDLARTQLSNRLVVDSLVMEVFNASNPAPDTWPAGPQYFAFVDNYVRYLETKAFAIVKKDSIKPNQPIPYYGISLDSANVAYSKYGKPYLRWICVSKNFSAPVAIAYNYQQLIKLYQDKDLRQFEGLYHSFKNKFPANVYQKDMDVKLTSLKNTLIANQRNPNIKIIDGYSQVKSIYDVVKNYKGKVIYLDIWGTWCGPCKEELGYVPELKAHFKGKNVVFIYLDMDEEDKDSSWKEFIKTNNMEGIHLRKNRQSIAPIWTELLVNAEDKEQYYPQYFIFDKDGKLAVTKANRPSSKVELYTQLERYLK